MMPPNQRYPICVKNLPEYTEKIIYHFFGNFGKIMSWGFVNTPDPHRKDAIIEYEHPQPAIEARNVNNGRIVNNCTLYVELIHPEPAIGPGNRFMDMNNQRFPFDGRNDNRMRGPDFHGNNNFGSHVNNGNFHGLRNENMWNNMRNGDMRPMQFPPINQRPPPQQQMGYPGPQNAQMYNEYRPPQNGMMPNIPIGPGMGNNIQRHHPNNFHVSAQLQHNLNNNAYPSNPPPAREPAFQGKSNYITIESPENTDKTINAILAKNPELKAHMDNPELVKKLINIFREEVSAMVGTKSNEKDRNHSRSSQRTRSPHREISPHHKRHANREDRSQSRSRSRSRQRYHNSSSKKPHYKSGHSRSRSHSKSYSRSRSPSYSPLPEYHKKESSSRSHNNRHQHNEHNRHHQHQHHHQRRSQSRSKSRSRSNQRDRYRHHSRSRSAGRNSRRREERVPHAQRERKEASKEMRIVLIDDDIPVFNAPIAKKNTEPAEYNFVNPEDLDLSHFSQATTTESLSVEKSISLESLKNHNQNPPLPQSRIIEPQQTVKIQKVTEIELKYPQFEGIISKMRTYREHEKARNIKTIQRNLQRAPEPKFKYSSLMEENKESNYPFNSDYNWPLATILGVYPDDLGSLDFPKNLQSNVKKLLEFPQAYSSDLFYSMKSMCELFKNGDPDVNHQIEGLLEGLADEEKEAAIKRMYGMISGNEEVPPMNPEEEKPEVQEGQVNEEKKHDRAIEISDDKESPKEGSENHDFESGNQVIILIP